LEKAKKTNENKRDNSRFFLPLLLLLILVGITYAFWQVAVTQDDPNIITTLACLDTTLTDETDAIYFTNEYPISNTAGMARDPYSFSVKNACDNPVNVDITLEVLDNTSLNHKYLRASVNRSGTTIDNSDIMTGFSTMNSTIIGATSYVIERDITMAPDESITFDLRLWLDQTTPYEEGSDKVANAKIVVVASPAPNTD